MAGMVLKKYLRTTSWSTGTERERDGGRVVGWEGDQSWHGFLTPQSPLSVTYFFSKATPFNLSDFIKEFYSLVTNHLNICTYGFILLKPGHIHIYIHIYLHNWPCLFIAWHFIIIFPEHVMARDHLTFHILSRGSMWLGRLLSCWMLVNTQRWWKLLKIYLICNYNIKC